MREFASRLFSHLFRTACGLLLGSLPVCAAALRELPAVEVYRTPRPIRIDGRLDEWTERPGVHLTPLVLPAGFSLPEDCPPDLDRLQTSFWTACDDDAFYVALQSIDPAPAINPHPTDRPAEWSRGGDGIELHFGAGRFLHVACWPGPTNAASRQGFTFRPHLAFRHGHDIRWRDGRLEGLFGAMRVSDSNDAYTTEIRIPWKLITDHGGPPADSMPLLIDLAWNELSTAFLRRLPPEILAVNTCLRFNYLTAAPQIASRHALTRHEQWGRLRFAAPGFKDPPQRLMCFEGTGATLMQVPPTGNPPVMDGSLVEWNPVQLHPAIVAPVAFGQRYAALIGMMYDRQGIFIGAHFHTATPMFSVETEDDPNACPAGDHLQVLLNMNGAFRSLCGWYSRASESGRLSMHGGHQGPIDLLDAGALQAFKPDPNGNGYTQEIFIPWTLLEQDAPPPPGTEWPATFRLGWSGLDPRFSWHIRLDFSKPGANGKP